MEEYRTKDMRRVHMTKESIIEQSYVEMISVDSKSSLI